VVLRSLFDLAFGVVDDFLSLFITSQRLGAWDRRIDKKLSMSCSCVTLGGDTPSVAEGGQPARRYSPISLAVAHPGKRGAETSSPVETIGRPHRTGGRWI